MSQPAPQRQDIPSPFSVDKAVPNRLVHTIPDELAQSVPDHPLFAYPKTDNVQDGFVDVSAKCFANAINRTAWYLESLLGKAPQGFPTVGYMGSSDLRYFLFFFGAIKAGYKMLFLSPRNNLAGHLNVLEKSDCHTFLIAKNTHLEQVFAARTMTTAVVPELEGLLDATEVQMYPYTKTFDEARKDACLVLHTTGSTGLPKPITWKLEILSTYEAWRIIPSIDGYIPTTEIYQEARRAYNSMPLFHTSGLNTGITLSLLLGVTTVFGSAGVVPHAAYADEMHKYANVDASIGPPTIYEELSHEPSQLERVNKLTYVLVCGAPISATAGNLLSKQTRLISNFGATETACLPRLAPAREDWAYYYWHPSHSGIELRETFDGLYELFLVKDPKIDLYQGIFSTFPHLDEYSMNDLYTKHPTKPFLYKWTGRADDVVVLNNGEKLAPALMEASLMSSPLVKGAMVVGRGKFQPAALLDLGAAPPTDKDGRQAIIKDLEPAIALANKHAPAHGKLDKLHIMFVDPARPIYYLGQGKIQRRGTYAKYDQDFEDLYQNAENIAEQEDDDSGSSTVDFGDQASIKQWLLDVITKVAEIEDLKGDDAFFEAGMDSLHVIRLVRDLKYQAKIAGGKLTPESLSPGVIYSHPSLDELAAYLYKQAGLAPAAPVDSAYQSTEEEAGGSPKLKYLESLLDKYVQTLSPKVEPRPAPVTQGTTVLLTGSTGSLGSYLLNELNNDPNVEHIICLDRSADGAEKHKQNAPKRGLTVTDSSRVEFLKSNLAEADLGLGKETYQRLVNTVTHVIHCQWPVNFNWVVGSFKPSIAGVRNISNLAAASAHNAFVLFISSIAAVDGYSGPGAVPEAPVQDLTAASKIGYGQSKLIAECLLDKAAEISGVRSAVCRVGIVAGPVESQLGKWNVHEYIPSIIVSSAHLGVFPKTFPSRDHIDWLPVDKLSSILVDILGTASEPSSTDNASPMRGKTYHVVNPHAASWGANFAADLMAAYPADTVKPVPFEEWVETLRQSAEAADGDKSVDVERNPAIRLLEFYTKASKTDKGRRILPTTGSEAASKTLRELGPLNRAWLENWMVQWGVKSN